jgi:hypothetical protein
MDSCEAVVAEPAVLQGDKLTSTGTAAVVTDAILSPASEVKMTVQSSPPVQMKWPQKSAQVTA